MSDNARTPTKRPRKPGPRSTAEERALRAEILAKRDQARAVRDPSLAREVRALRQKARDLRTAARDAFVSRPLQPKRPVGRPRLPAEVRARRAPKKVKLAELIKAIEALSNTVDEFEILTMGSHHAE